MNFLVSGVGGDIGFGVGRILKDWQESAVVHGIDIQAEHAGLFVFDRCAVAPRAFSCEYIDWVSDYISANNINIFIPTSEAEISRLTKEGLSKIGDARILKSNDLTILKSLDKFECLRFLSSNGVRVPANGVVGFQKPKYYPVIVKPRSGQGSKGIRRIDDNAAYCALQVENAIWQEYLAPDDEEYTCPVYRSPEAGIRVLVLKRKLQGGLTVSGEVVDNAEIIKYVEVIASLLNLKGVMNIQLRLTASGPLLFEINPRLSSTLVFRDKMGFCDLRWWLADVLGFDMPPYQPPQIGTRFYRGAQEYVCSSGAKNV